VIHLDTSVLIDALTGFRRSAPALRAVLDRGERIGIAAPVLYEWLRGPRLDVELAHQEALLPAGEAWPFGPREAGLAAELYRAVPRARRREFDLAVAACALTGGAVLWTRNAGDFRDIPDLELLETS
jgi:predicted nucleic acid-binding protein